MLTAGSNTGTLTADDARLFEQALKLLGGELVRAREQALEIRLRDRRLELTASTIGPQLRDLPELPAMPSATHVAAALACVLNEPIPEALVQDLDFIRPWLRPQLVKTTELQGPRRAMCRREAFGGLLLAIAAGRGPRCALLTTKLLDAWKLTFDEVLVIAKENLAIELAKAGVHDIEGSAGVLAIAHDIEPACCAYLLFDRLLAEWDAVHGAVFAVPDEETTLVLPVEEGGGSEGVAGLIQAALSWSADTESASGELLSDQVFWIRRDGDIARLPMTRIEERAGRRVQLEATGPMSDLLTILGEVTE
ncbi:MAG: hypothetical protein KDA20_08430 [Phycisphaerales bacterium]|nr:hypothetical protein [Phycisphaerales bacterium]